MPEKYFTVQDFNDDFALEILNAKRVYENMKKSGLKDYQYCTFDFDFISNEKSKLDSLADFLLNNYGYKINEIKKEDGDWVLRADATPIPVDSNTLVYWAIDMYKLGFKYDSKLSGYGALVDTATFPDLSPEKADFYFDQGLEAYNKGNRSQAIIYWTTVLKIDPDEPNSYYSRAIAKYDLNLTKDALRDYDKALEIAPEFTSALVNRATVKDESGDYDGAIQDYDRAIEIDNENAMAYFNRGNTKFNKGDKEGACSDWKKAKALGDEYADERLVKEKCK